VAQYITKITAFQKNSKFKNIAKITMIMTMVEASTLAIRWVHWRALLPEISFGR
jgi:hypothetical protein